MRERGPILRHVPQLEPFSLPGQKHLVVPDPAAAAHGVHAEFGGGPGTCSALATVPERRARQRPRLPYVIGKCERRPRGTVFL
jgi:hypothetical protein